jgi:hypothetical protein
MKGKFQQLSMEQSRAGVKSSMGFPQGSVLGPILFSLFCNDLPDITKDVDDETEMYADDTTIYAVGKTPDIVANSLNSILHKLSIWCQDNLLTPHLGKTEYMLLGCSNFTGPFQDIRFAGGSIKQVHSKLSLGVKIDSGLKWNLHTSELVLSFNSKLSLLKPLYFLPKQAKLDFYFKVIIPSITYGVR